MADEGINVKFGAEIGGVVDGASSARNAIKDATEGMKGDLSSLSDVVKEFGASALIIGGVALAFEGVREAIIASIESAREAAEQYEKTASMTGISVLELNKWDMATRMSGTSLDFLNRLVVGATRSLKQHNDQVSDLIGVSNAAGLASDDFGSYLAKVTEKSHDYQEGIVRDGFLTLALGRSAVGAGAELEKLAENMNDATKSVNMIGDHMTTDGIEKVKLYTKETGELSYMWDLAKAQIGVQVLPFITEKLGGLVDMQRDYLAQLRAGISPMRAWWNEMKVIAGSKDAAETIAEIADETERANAAFAEYSKFAEHFANREKIKKPPTTDKEEKEKSEKKLLLPTYKETEKGVMYGYEDTVYQADTGDTKKDVEAEQKRQLELAKIKSKFEMENFARLKKEVAEETKLWMGLFMTIERGFVDDLKAGKSFTDTMSDLFRNLGAGILDVFQQIGEKWVEQLITQQVMTHATNQADIESEANAAYANAFASTAAIPIIGPELAPGVAAAAYANVMGHLPMARYGMPNVPKDGPVYVHEGERIMTKTENIRSKQGMNAGTTIHIHGALDPHAVAKQIARVLPQATKIAGRNYAMQGAR